MLNGRTALVTGASGFIGSHLVEALLAADATVIGVDNFLTGRRQNLPSHVLSHSRFRLIEADVSQPVETYLEDETIHPEFVFHFASPASPPLYQAHPVETYLVNSIGTHYLAQWLLQHAPESVLVFAGTSEAYGDPTVHPQPETYWGNVNPNGPRSCYDEAKRLGETICGVHYRDFGLDTRIVRIFNTYGPRMDPHDGRVIPNFLNQALKGQPLTIYGDGSQTRSYCFVSDLVRGVLALAIVAEGAGQTVNLGNPDEYSIFETAKAVIRVVHGREPVPSDFEFKPLPVDDPTRRQPAISKAEALLQWRPQVEFSEGLRETLAYFSDTMPE